jgi:hypothetical protein
MFSFSLSLQRSELLASTPAAPTKIVTLNALSRDRALFDSGAAFGRAEASVPFAGSGTAGEIVQARAISLDDGGATTTPWTDVATIAAGGLWSGTIVAPRSSSWYRPEVRLKATTGVTAQGVNRFGVGHVMAIWGQSEPDRILSSFYDNTTPPAVSDPEAVQIIFGAAASPSNHFVTTAQPYTAAVAALASSLIATRPDEKFAVIFHTVSGTDVRALVNDGDTSRSWLADKALHDYATADGQKVGFAAMSWFAAPGSLGSYYGQALFPLLSGKMLDGTPVSFPATIPSGVSSSFHADHWFGELYDYTNTKWVAYGPHRFDIDADMQDATHLLGGATQFALTNKQDARASWRAMLAAPAATMLLPLGLEPVAYVNGTNTGAGGWTDVPHPAGDTPDGAQAFARLTGLAILQAAGMTSWAVPEFDNCYWEPAGTYVEVWSSTGPVTTTRLARSEAPLPATYPHWTTVLGFQINGQTARNTQIVAGRVRIFPNAGGNFASTDTIQYGEGGASGAVKFPQDALNAVWKNIPIVDVGAAGLTGIAVRPLPNPSVFANTLPAGVQIFSTAATGPYFTSPTPVPSGTPAITFQAKFKLAAMPASSQCLFSQSNIGLDLQVLNNGSVRCDVKDGAGVKTLNGTMISAGILPNVWYDIVLSVDHTSKFLWFKINGVLLATVPFTTAGNGEFQSTRALSFLARGSGSIQFVGDVEYLKVWHEVTGTGDAPTSLTVNQVFGPAAAANLNAWKLGANAT